MKCGKEATEEEAVVPSRNKGSSKAADPVRELRNHALLFTVGRAVQAGMSPHNGQDTDVCTHSLCWAHNIAS